jgi:hypothetical protein
MKGAEEITTKPPPPPPSQQLTKQSFCPTEQSDTSLGDLLQILPLYFSSITDSSIWPDNDSKMTGIVHISHLLSVKERSRDYTTIISLRKELPKEVPIVRSNILPR